MSFDIVVDVDAYCHSLTLKGHNVTVKANVHLNILGDAKATLLTKYIEINTTLAAPLDTTSKMLLSYDNAKRNTAINLTYYSDDHRTSYQYVSTFFYNGADTLLFKKR